MADITPGGTPPQKSGWQQLPTWAQIGILLGVIVVLFALFGDALNDAGDSGTEFFSDEPCTKNVVYEVDGSATKIDITMETSTGNTSQQSGLSVPLTSRGESEPGLQVGTFSCGDFAYISAQNQGESGSLTCRIRSDGVVIEEATSNGAYVIVTCSGEVR